MKNRTLNRINKTVLLAMTAMLVLTVMSMGASATTFVPAGTLGTSIGVPPDYGWYTSDVKITLISATTNPVVYKIDGEPTWKSYTGPLTITKEGNTQIDYRENHPTGPGATDTAYVYIDKKVPLNIPTVISGSITSYGWYNVNPSVKFVCDDGAVPPASGCVSGGTTVTILGEGLGQSTTWTAEDKAGNKNLKTVHANIDKTFPVLTGSPEVIPPVPNGKNGWYTGPVKIITDAIDNPPAPGIVPSGLVWESHQEWVLTDGIYTLLDRWIADKAGNLAIYPLPPIYIDSIKPKVEITEVTGGASYKGSAKADINIFDLNLDNTQTDVKLNGVNYVSGTPITTEGSYELKVSACDLAGNCESKSVKFVVDNTLPTITGKATTDPNADGWYNKDVVVKFTCSDALSGMTSCGPDQTVSKEDLNQFVTGYAIDKAGNKNSALVGPISLDKTPPVIHADASKAPNADGWYNSNVEINFDAYDVLSGMKLPDKAKITSSGEGSNVQVSWTAEDIAGNKGTGIFTLKVDITDPKIVITGVEDGKTYNGPVTPVVTVSDCSGCAIKTNSIKLNGASFVSGTTISTNGVYTLVAEAVDYVGKSASKTVIFTVDIKSQGDILSYYRGQTGNNNVVDTQDLLKAADDWSKGTIPTGFSEPLSTAQLLKLADEWSNA